MKLAPNVLSFSHFFLLLLLFWQLVQQRCKIQDLYVMIWISSLVLFVITSQKTEVASRLSELVYSSCFDVNSSVWGASITKTFSLTAARQLSADKASCGLVWKGEAGRHAPLLYKINHRYFSLNTFGLCPSKIRKVDVPESTETCWWKYDDASCWTEAELKPHLFKGWAETCQSSQWSKESKHQNEDELCGAAAAHGNKLHPNTPGLHHWLMQPSLNTGTCTSHTRIQSTGTATHNGASGETVTSPLKNKTTQDLEESFTQQ